MDCQLCTHNPEENQCDHSKNAYCQVFLNKAEQDAKDAGMHPSIHTKAQEIEDNTVHILGDTFALMV